MPRYRPPLLYGSGVKSKNVKKITSFYQNALKTNSSVPQGKLKITLRFPYKIKFCITAPIILTDQLKSKN